MNPFQMIRDYIARVQKDSSSPTSRGTIYNIISNLGGPDTTEYADQGPVNSPNRESNVTAPLRTAAPQVAAPVQTPQPSQLPGYNPSRGMPDDEMLSFIQSAAQTYDVDPSLLAAQLFTESGIKPLGREQDNLNRDKNGNILSRDRGIAQVNDYWHPEVSDAQAYDPQFGVNFMAKTLANNTKKYGKSNIDLAIAAYNVGHGGLENNADAARTYQSKVWQSLTPDKAYQLGMATPSAFLK